MAYQPKNYRKFVATAATATLVASAIAPVASAADFKDVSSKYKEAVDFVVSKGASGTTATTFGTDANIKRGDAAVLLAKVLGLDTDAPSAGFKDVNSRLAPYINALKEAGITSGKTETTFAPDALITRGELAIWIQRGFDLEGASDLKFKDVNKNYQAAVQALVANGVATGTSSTTFGTTNNAKRGDYALFLYRADQATAEDTKAPELKYDGSTSVTVENGASFTVPTVTATDNVDKDVKVTHVITDASGKQVSAIDTKEAGTYKITYSATDAAGNKATELVVTVTVKEPATPAVNSVSASNAAQIQVTFNQPVYSSDIINNGVLQNVTVTPETANGETADDPGTLTPVLSKDGKTLTLTAAQGEKFEGKYTVKISKDSVRSVEGAYFSAYEGSVTVNDTTRPTFKGVTYNPAGTLAYLEFSEPIAAIDNDFEVTSVSRADGTALNGTVINAGSFSNHEANRNVIVLNLAGISTADANKNLNVNFVGLKDAAGNLVTPNPVTATVNKDTTEKAQATITSISRTALDTVEVSFDKELETAPSVSVNGGTAVTATPTEDARVYEVALTESQQNLTGLQNVTLSGWDAYNTTAPATAVTRIVDFTVEKVAPKITSTSLTKINNKDYLIVNFDEDVTKEDLAAGTFTGTVSRPNGDLEAIPTVNFAEPTFYNATLNATTAKSIKIDLSTLQSDGETYTFAPGAYNVEISGGIAKDAFGNASAKKSTSFTISTSTAKLPAPSNIASKANTPNVIQVTFGNKVDVASAQTVSNYSIEGVTLQDAKVVTNTDSGATVELTVAPGSITHEGVRQVSVKNIKGFADSYTAMDDYTIIKSFTENVAPKLEATNPVRLTSTSTILVDFDEALVDTNVGNDFEVYQNGVKVASSSVLGTDASQVVITLTNPVSTTSGLVVKAASTIDLRDANYNKAVFSETSVSY